MIAPYLIPSLIKYGATGSFKHVLNTPRHTNINNWPHQHHTGCSYYLLLHLPTCSRHKILCLLAKWCTPDGVAFECYLTAEPCKLL